MRRSVDGTSSFFLPSNYYIKNAPPRSTRSTTLRTFSRLVAVRVNRVTPINDRKAAFKAAPNLFVCNEIYESEFLNLGG